MVCAKYGRDWLNTLKLTTPHSYLINPVLVSIGGRRTIRKKKKKKNPPRLSIGLSIIQLRQPPAYLMPRFASQTSLS